MHNRSLTCGIVLLALAAGPPAWAAYSLAPAPASHASQGQGYLGVDLRDVGEAQVASLKLKNNRGAEIVLVDHDGPAGKVGLREHDVVLQMNGQPVSSQDQVRHMLHECPPGQTVILLISRDGQQFTVSPRMSTREEVEREAWAQHITVPDPQQPAPSTESASSSFAAAASPTPAPTRAGNSFISSLLMNSSYTGAILEQLNAQLAQFFGAPTGAGLLVRSVVDNSPAAISGMHAGDVIVRAGDKNIASTSDWSKVIKSSHNRPLSVVVLRDKKEHTLTLTPDGRHRSSLEQWIELPERSVVAHLNLAWLPHV